MSELEAEWDSDAFKNFFKKAINDGQNVANKVKDFVNRAEGASEEESAGEHDADESAIQHSLEQHVRDLLKKSASQVAAIDAEAQVSATASKNGLDITV